MYGRVGLNDFKLLHPLPSYQKEEIYRLRMEIRLNGSLKERPL